MQAKSKFETSLLHYNGEELKESIEKNINLLSSNFI